MAINNLTLSGIVHAQPTTKEIGQTHLTTVVIAHISERRGQAHTDLIPVDFFGDTAEKAYKLPVGAKILISGKASGREYQEKYYCSIRAMDFEVVSGAPAPSAAPPEAEDIPW